MASEQGGGPSATVARGQVPGAYAECTAGVMRARWTARGRWAILDAYQRTDLPARSLRGLPALSLLLATTPYGSGADSPSQGGSDRQWPYQWEDDVDGRPGTGTAPADACSESIVSERLEDWWVRTWTGRPATAGRRQDGPDPLAWISCNVGWMDGEAFWDGVALLAWDLYDG